MKICFYTDTFLPNVGGAEMVLDNLAGRLTSAGESVMVLAPRVRGRWNDNALSYPVCRFRKPLSKRYGVRLLLPRLIALHIRHRFDLIHCHSSYPAAYVAVAFKKLFGVPVVVRPHGTDIMPGRRIRSHPRVEARLKQALAGVDAVIAQGRFLRDLLLDLGVEEGRLRTIHNGVDLQKFQQSSSVPYSRPYLLAVGSLKPLKGFDILLKAYARLRNPTPDLIIAGTGPDELKLKQLAEQLGIRGRVQFVGFVDGQRKVDLFRSAEFLVCPSRIESFSNVILEALASGLPVVASAVGGNPELVRDGEHGLLCQPDDAESLAAALTKLLNNPRMQARFRDAVGEFVRPFDWPIVIGRYLDLYREVIQDRPLTRAA